MKQLALGAAMAAVLALATTLGFPSYAMQSRTAIDVASLGPQVGEQVPDFSLPDQNGRVWTRDSILGPNGALVLFHRSADW
jgi:cytochrome oxidase Cu insertion factor (SCO1/SenC/PrrC family)